MGSRKKVIVRKRVRQVTHPVPLPADLYVKDLMPLLSPLSPLRYRFLGSARFNAMLPRVKRGLKKDAMGRRRLVNSRSRRLEATHWRHSKYAANFTDGPADV